MMLAIVEHVAGIRDFYSVVGQRAGWLYSWLPVLLSMLHMECKHIQSTFSFYPTIVPIYL